jgi:hypothetical protein
VGRFEQDVERMFAGDLPEYVKGFDFDLWIETGESCLIPTVEIIVALRERLDCDYLPKPETVSRWADQYLRLYDEQIDKIDPIAGFKEERRQVIVDTYERLLRHSRLIHSCDGTVTDRAPDA